MTECPGLLVDGYEQRAADPATPGPGRDGEVEHLERRRPRCHDREPHRQAAGTRDHEHRTVQLEAAMHAWQGLRGIARLGPVAAGCRLRPDLGSDAFSGRTALDVHHEPAHGSTLAGGWSCSGK